MEVYPRYTFVPLAQKNYILTNDKRMQEMLSKWGLKGNFVIQNFTFNEPFQKYQKYHLVEAFFKDDTVAKALITKQGNTWVAQGITASTVEIKQVPCSILSMSFFNKLKNPESGIVQKSGAIHKRYDTEIDGFLISDNLRAMLLDDESVEYNLYLKDEREEFIFRLFQLFALGGVLCQYEDTLDPYLEITKNSYKDLIRVQAQTSSEDLIVSTSVFEVVAKDYRKQAYFPSNPHKQNVGFLLVDVAAICHKSHPEEHVIISVVRKSDSSDHRKYARIYLA